MARPINFRELRADAVEAQKLLEKTFIRLILAIDVLIDLEDDFVSSAHHQDEPAHPQPQEIRKWGKELQDYRKKNRRSRPWLSKKLGVSLPVVHDIENGRIPSKVMVKKLDRLLRSA